ncbi:chlorophyllase [Frondihabitans sp. PAMC 28766]|uniref:alpha/beta hydrolase family protein n=1 Tax=Frondihabitans sp. PAMC 28766 TaxID=1795630 RepID=UPI00078C2AAB|nr:chlorophyllase [Frondihabitans sp. PAMC 28766]AMM21617.1 chlorophyllase [Frondihabitans sp. PAMC 28766]
MTLTTHLTAEDDPIVSVKPITLASPGRGVDLTLRLSAPVSGAGLPVILFSHGFGESLSGYGPLTDYWASHGFVVLQPTYLDSRSIGLADDDGRRAGIWRQRAADASRTLDQLDEALEAIPGLPERVDRSRIAAAGHSFGGQTTGILLGLRVLDPETSALDDLRDPRVKAGVLLATAGRGADLSPLAAEHFPFMRPTFDHMEAPALVVLGDRDDSPLSTRGPDWSADPYSDSPGEKHLLTLIGGEHSLGGVPGYDVKETTDENPERVILLRSVAAAFLRHALGIDESAWNGFRETLGGAGSETARLESKK